MMTQQTATRSPTEHEWHEASQYIFIVNGATYYIRAFKESWPGSFEHLLMCVEDHACDGLDDPDRIGIDWSAVQKSYEATQNQGAV